MEKIKDILKREGYPKPIKLLSNTLREEMPDQDIIRSCAEQKALEGYGPNPGCEVCRGFGIVNPLLDSGKPDYTRVANCQAEGCIESQKQAYMATEAYLKGKGINKLATFHDFKPVLGSTAILQAFKAIAFDKNAPPLLIVYGTTGNGKTHLCEAAAAELLKRGVDCRLWAVADLVSRLKESISDNSTEQMMSGLKKLPALILDDWGQNYGSPWETQKLEEIVVARDRAGLITIITTNLELDELPERIVSRGRDAAEAVILLNPAPDFRPLKKARREANSE